MDKRLIRIVNSLGNFYIIYSCMTNVTELLFSDVPDSELLFVEDTSSITYGEARSKVVSIACYLAEKKISNQPILVPVKRDYNTILLFLGIAASNNYYVPVSEDTPKTRLSDIIQIGDISFGFSCPFLSGNLDIQKALRAPISEDLLDSMRTQYHANNPLYLMFTSGSTGKPKDVLKSHGSVLAFVENFRKTFPFIPNHLRLCNQTPFYFDASSKDIYLTLALESTLYIPSKATFALPNKSVEYLKEHQIDMIMWVPSALILIAKIRALKFIKPESLKYVFFIGEVFPPKYFNMWQEALPQVRYFNWYGSTEISGACLYYEITSPLKADKVMKTGKPLFGNEVKLINGEICVSSPQLALGYIKDDERNRSTFREEEGKIFLHTGDYGEYDQDKNIIFRSRKDFQIKHMGYRIELQDIETCVNSLKDIGICCCLYQREKDRIVLFVTLSDKSKTVMDVLNECRKVLADYMMPNRVILLDEMPLNNNGKIDRTKLKEIMEN